MLKVELVPILEDNYVHIAIDDELRECLIVDPGVAAPVQKFLKAQNLKPVALLLTHHHGDHIGGALELQQAWQIPSYVPLKEKKDIPFGSYFLQEGDVVQRGAFRFQVLELPGHTRGHIAYWEKTQKWLFSGDVLFCMGCGRVFEGTMLQHYQSLHRLKALPPETMVYCTHEYTAKNLQFALKRDPSNPSLLHFAEKIQSLRQQKKPTVPFPLSQELALNPFLLASSAAEFQTLREARNSY